MGTISSSGLVSGIDTQSLIKQLMAIEGRPLDLVNQQIKKTQAIQTAFLDLSARFTTALAGLNRLASREMFRTRSATSSNPAVLSASASAGTAIGSYSFRVLALASTHQLVSAGLPNRDRASIGAGTLTFEAAAGRLDTSTALSSLNGTSGVRQGVIRITDREGNKADIDLTGTSTIEDVLRVINSQADVNVRASISGDQVVISDISEAGTGNLRIQDVGNSHTAADLGIAGTSATGQITGKDLVYLTASSRLGLLNDGLGIRTNTLDDDLRIRLGDGTNIDVSLSSHLKFTTQLAALNHGQGITDGTIRITNRNGQFADVAIAATGTVQDVITAINASGLSVSASLSGSKINIADTSGGTSSNLKIEDISGSAAQGLGILTDVDANSASGSEIYGIDTVGDVLRAFQFATGNNGRISAGISADGSRIVLTDANAQAPFEVEALNGSMAAEDLGLIGSSVGNSLEGRELIAGLNTVMLRSLNGGSGVTTGTVRFSLRDGRQIDVDFAGARTLDDVISRINNAQDGQGVAAGLVAGIDAGGTGFSIVDSSTGTGTFSVSDLTATTAADLHLTAAGEGKLASGDLQRKYISENTVLSGLNGGEGIQFGSFRITNSKNESENIILVASAQKTIGDVIKAINANSINVTAHINANGDGIELVDNSGGSGQLTIAERDNGTTAASLGILGKAAAGATTFTGTFARQVTISGSDSLDVIAKKINDADAGVSASILNDGSINSPYRLVITSDVSGKKGQMAYSSTIPGFSLDTMAEAQDAVVAVGSSNLAGSMVVTSNSNSVTGLVDGLTLDLTSTSSSPVTVTVGQDVDAVVESMNAFIKSVNDAMDRISELTSYNAETEEKGILLGDFTVQQIQEQFYSLLTKSITGKGLTYTNLTQLGLKIGDGATLSLDETKFRAAFAKDPEAVEKLFTMSTKDAEGKTVKNGIGLKLQELVEQITNTVDGTIAKQNKSLQERVDLYNERATHLQALLAKKQERLVMQFNNMELILSKLQSQQSSLASLAASIGATTSGS